VTQELPQKYKGKTYEQKNMLAKNKMMMMMRDYIPAKKYGFFIITHHRCK
jgi:hypothetical protein